MEVHAQVASEAKLFSGAPTAFRRRAEQPCEPGRCGDAGHAAGHQRGMRPAGDPHRPGAEGEDQPPLRLRAERTTSIPICRRAIRSRNTTSRSWARARWSSRSGRTRAAPSRRCGSGSSGCISSRTPASSLHDQHPTMSYVDLNRSGVALMEIVSKPDIRSSDEARAFLTKLRTILRYLGTSDADMEKGNLRADVNVSVRRPGEKLGTRCEIKNVNSIRFAGAGDRARGAAADRHSRGRRRDRAGDAALRSRARRDALHALEGRGARLSLFPRSGPAAARIRRGLRGGARRIPAGTAGREAGRAS